MNTDAPKLTIKQEAFARAYVETGNASEAYRRAYDAGRMSKEAINVNACKLCSHDKVALRIAELRARVAEKHDITLDRLTQMALAAYGVGQECQEAAGMVAAVKQLSKMHGFEVERRENARDAFEGLNATDRKLVFDAIDSELARRSGQAGVSSETGSA